MERTIETVSSCSPGDPNKIEHGAGGKLRRQQPRRPPFKPYARSQQNQSLRGRLLSKLVDPACRFIAGGATKIFPSFFSKPLTIDSLPPSEPQTLVNLDEDREVHANGEDKACSSIFGVCKTTGSTATTDGSNAASAFPSFFSKPLTINSLPPSEPQTQVNLDEEHANGEDQACSSIFGVCKTTGSTGITDGSKTVSEFAENREGDKVDINDVGLSEIEKLMTGKTFSRDEINRLIGIINSRVVDVPKVDKGSKDLIMSAQGAKRTVVSQNPGRPTEEKQDDLDKAADLATPLPKPTLVGETGLSPIEIAKAYMASRTSELTPGSRSILSKDEKLTMVVDDFASESFVPLPSPKSSTCWPGSMVHDKCGYLTPQSQRSRFGLHNISRTPYTRTIYTKSKPKLAHVRDDGNGLPNGGFSPLQLSKTPVYGQLRSDVVEDGHGSVGPIRRIRHKCSMETPSRGSVYSHSSLNGPFPVGNSEVSKGPFPSIKRNLEQGGTSSSSVFQSIHNNRSSEMGIPPVHPHSSQMARTILEHLERNLTIPEKSDELKMSTSLKRSQSTDPNDAVLNGCNSAPYLGFGSSKGKDQMNNSRPAQWNEDRGNLVSLVLLESTIGTKNVTKTSSASDLKVDSTVTMLGNNAGPSLDFGKTQDSQIKTAYKDLPKVTEAAVSDGLRKPSSNSMGNKPVLASISVSKPEQRWIFTSDNSSGFTFPVSASSGVSSEPPTPSIMPLVSGNSSQHQPKEENTGPSFSFGSNRSSPALVFSSPSTSSAPNDVDASDITFNFGSDQSSRISFSSIGKKYHMLQTPTK